MAASSAAGSNISRSAHRYSAGLTGALGPLFGDGIRRHDHQQLATAWLSRRDHPDAGGVRELT